MRELINEKIIPDNAQRKEERKSKAEKTNDVKIERDAKTALDVLGLLGSKYRHHTMKPHLESNKNG